MNPRAMRRLMLGLPNDALLSVTATFTAGKDHHLRTLVLNAAAGVAVTLPPALGTGLVLRFVVGTTITSNSTTIKVANTTDVMNGLIVASTDNATTTNNVWSAAATDDTITLDGSTRGGIIGDRIELIDMKSGFWQVTGWIAGTGTEATPFSATV